MKTYVSLVHMFDICAAYADSCGFSYARIPCLAYQPAAGEANRWVPLPIYTRLGPRLQSDHGRTNSSLAATVRGKAPAYHEWKITTSLQATWSSGRDWIEWVDTREFFVCAFSFSTSATQDQAESLIVSPPLRVGDNIHGLRQ